MASTSTQKIATGTCARPSASREPSGAASCAPTTAPPKKPDQGERPDDRPVAVAADGVADRGQQDDQVEEVHDQLGRTTSVPVCPCFAWIVQTNR